MDTLLFSRSIEANHQAWGLVVFASAVQFDLADGAVAKSGQLQKTPAYPFTNTNECSIIMEQPTPINGPSLRGISYFEREVCVYV